jgi:hypothetical protein
MRPALSLTALLLAVASTGSAAQPASQHGWRFVAAPHVDLWYHALAVVGFQPMGSLPYYAPGYRTRIAAAREAAGVGPTQLESEAAALRGAFSADPAFQVLHFLPLYFVGGDATDMFEAMRRAADGTGSAARPGTGADLIVAVLPSSSQRALLARFGALLEEEWHTFYGAYWSDREVERTPWLAGLQASWGARYQTALTPYLDAFALTGGTVVVVEALGAEGRSLSGDPSDPRDNLIAVGGGVGDGPPRLLDFVVRELCFPAVRRAHDAATLTSRGDAAVRLNSVAGVRCGDMLLARVHPGSVAGYRSAFLEAVGATDRGFDETFALPPDLETALLSTVAGF